MAVGIPLGPYRLVRRLATGGMAEIFLARQEGKDGFARDVVVKRILPHLAADPEFTRMFRDEARLAALLSHPNVVHVYDFGSEVEADGREVLWLAMELVRGVDLRALIFRAAEEARATGRQGAIPPHHAAKILSFVCEALAHAHSLRVQGKPAGVVHRDVTPSNVLVSFDGAVKLADFGIAKARTHRSKEATEHGVVKGKPAYLSPEQARGENLDARSDLFNVGILLFEAITGEPLFPHDDFRRAQMLSAAGRIPDAERIHRLPPALAKITRRALAPRREDRFSDALALRAELETYLRSCEVHSDAVEIGRFVRYLFPDALEEDARAPRAAGTVPATSVVRFGAPVPSVAPAQGTQRIESDVARTVVAPPGIPPPLPPLAHAAAPGGEGATGTAPVDAATTSSVAPRTRPHTRTRRTAVAAAIGASAGIGIAIALARVATAPEASRLPAAPPDAPPVAPPAVAQRPPAVVPAQLRLRTAPPGLPLFVDARPIGPAPAVLELSPGPHRVEVRDERGAILASEGLSLEAGEVRELELSVAAAGRAELAHLRVDTTPPGATVRIDGEVVGTTPLAAEVAPSRYRVFVELPGYAPADTEVSLSAPGEQATLSFALRRTPRAPRGGGATTRTGGSQTGELTIATTPWSEVYLGSRHLGTTPLANVRLPAGSHTLTLRAPGRPPQYTTVTIRPGENTRVRLVL
jgi:serine/threonine-protein kinase